MKNIICLLLVVFFISACKNEEIGLNDTGQGLKLIITEINTDNSNSFVLESNDYINIPKWSDNSTSKINVERRIQFNSQMPSLDALKVELWFRKMEDKETLILSEEVVVLDTWTKIRSWDYRENQLELTEFYKNPNTFSGIVINGLIPSGSPLHFEVTEASKVEVNGAMVTWVEIDISGELYGAYTPGKGAGIKVKGTFKGVIE